MSSGDGHPDAVTNTEERHSLGLSHSESFCLICQHDNKDRELSSVREQLAKMKEHAIQQATELDAATHELAEARMAMTDGLVGVEIGHLPGLIRHLRTKLRISEEAEKAVVVELKDVLKIIRNRLLDMPPLEGVRQLVFANTLAHIDKAIGSNTTGCEYLHFTQIPSVLRGTYAGVPFPENNQYEREMSKAEYELVSKLAPLYGFRLKD